MRAQEVDFLLNVVKRKNEKNVCEIYNYNEVDEKY